MLINPQASRKRKIYQLYDSLFYLKHLIAPQFCLACNRQIYYDVGLCRECWMKTKWLNCINLETKSTLLTQTMLISQYYSLTSYHNQPHFKLLIKALKYHNRKDIGIYLGTILGEKIKQTWQNFQWDIIVPVPLHFTKKWERGYNQSHYIAKGIAKILEIPIANHAISRKKKTSTQTKLNIERRKENLKGAFSLIKPESIQHKRVLIVDDVCTTGSTILSMIDELCHVKGVIIGVATICTA